MAITRVSALLLAALCGCASSQATTGLASAPKLGTSASRERPPYDVIANGPESCERATTAAPTAWSRFPACPVEVPPAPVSFSKPRTPPSPSWVPRSRWSVPACWIPDGTDEALAIASCCPSDAWTCMR